MIAFGTRVEEIQSRRGFPQIQLLQILEACTSVDAEEWRVSPKVDQKPGCDGLHVPNGRIAGDRTGWIGHKVSAYAAANLVSNASRVGCGFAGNKT
jgi:hypothetical protein